MTYLTRRIVFSAAHRYYSPKLSEKENKKTFGILYSKHGDGHNYVLEVTVGGTVSGQTGMVMNITDLDRILSEIIQPLDHHHLNEDVPEFKNVIPTPENIALYCFSKIKKALPSKIVLSNVRLFEGDSFWVDLCE